MDQIEKKNEENTDTNVVENKVYDKPDIFSKGISNVFNSIEVGVLSLVFIFVIFVGYIISKKFGMF
jgi:hypothetical protein